MTSNSSTLISESRPVKAAIAVVESSSRKPRKYQERSIRGLFRSAIEMVDGY